MDSVVGGLSPFPEWRGVLNIQCANCCTLSRPEAVSATNRREEVHRHKKNPVCASHSLPFRTALQQRSIRLPFERMLIISRTFYVNPCAGSLTPLFMPNDVPRTGCDGRRCLVQSTWKKSFIGHSAFRTARKSSVSSSCAVGWSL